MVVSSHVLQLPQIPYGLLIGTCDDVDRAIRTNSCARPSPNGFGARCELPREVGRGFWQFYNVSDSIQLSITYARYRRLTRIEVPGEDLLKFRFIESGRVDLPFSPFVLRGPDAGASFHPRGTDIGYAIAPERTLMVVLHVKPQLLTEQFGLASSAENPLAELIDLERRQPRAWRVPMVGEMRANIRALVNAPYAGSTARIFREAKCLELICNMLHMFSLEKLDEPKSMRLRRADIDRLRCAREILASRVAEPPTIAELAREIGINRTKLKAGFKALFKTTIFEFCHHERMKSAERLLLDTDQCIADVASAVGFTHPSSFTVSFKRHFGYAPKELRKRGCAERACAVRNVYSRTTGGTSR